MCVFIEAKEEGEKKEIPLSPITVTQIHCALRN